MKIFGFILLFISLFPLTVSAQHDSLFYKKMNEVIKVYEKKGYNIVSDDSWGDMQFRGLPAFRMNFKMELGPIHPAHGGYQKRKGLTVILNMNGEVIFKKSKKYIQWNIYG